MKELFEKLSTFAHHHQLIFALIAGFCLICVSWGIEKILDEFIFPNKSASNYLLAVVGGLVLLWITQHYILKSV